MTRTRNGKSNNNKDGVTVTPKALAAAVSIMALAVGLYTQVSKVATKDDVKELAVTYNTSYKDIEARVRALEVQMASFFGRSTNTPAILKPQNGIVSPSPKLMRVQYPDAGNPANQSSTSSNSSAMSQYNPPRRRMVVTYSFIKTHEMTTWRSGSGYAVLGEDGQFYALDDILAILVQEHQELVHSPKTQMKK